MLHQQNCSQTNKIEQAHMLQVRHLDFNPKKQHIMVKLKLNPNFPKPSSVPFSSLIYGIDSTFFLQGGGQRWENKSRMKLCGLCGWVDVYFIMVKSVSISPSYDSCFVFPTSIACAMIDMGVLLWKITAGDDSRIRIWDLKMPNIPLQELPGHQHW